MSRRIIVFEELRNSHAWYVLWRCWRGDEVYYVRAPLRVKRRTWFTRLVADKQLQDLTFRNPVYFGLNAAADRAFAVVEPLYEKLFSGIPAVARLEKLFGSTDIHLAFKKVMNEELTDALYCELLRERIREMLPGKSRAWVVPSEPGMASKNARWRSILPEEGATNSPPFHLVFPLWLRLDERFREIFAWMKVLAMYLYFPVVCLRNGTLFGRKPIHDESLQYAIAIYSPAREFANTIRGVGFLLDGDQLRKDNTVFIPLSSLTRAQREFLTRNDFQLAELPAGAGIEILRAYLGLVFSVLCLWLFHPEWISRTYVRLLWTYGLWKGFAECHPVKHFISYCDFGFWHIGRNILLRRGGIQTWFYVDTVNGPDNFPKPDDGLPYRQHIYGFLYYDHFVSWCERHARWNRMLHQRIGCYHDVGCLWAEHIRLIKEGGIPSFFPDRLVEAGCRSGLKVVTVFDSWFHDAGVNTSSDLRGFIFDMERLVNDFEDIFLVVKEKKARWLFQEPYFPRAESSAVYAAYDRLEQHPRCFFPGPSANPSEIVAAGHLTIAFPFTSVGIEALAARCPALYHDAANKHRGAYYDRIPGLVTYGYDELRSSVRRVLYETSQEDYDRFLDAEVKGDAESFLDGRGLTRFRRLLAE